MAKTGLQLKINIRHKSLNRVSGITEKKAREKIALTMLDFMVSGSPRSSATAPIRFGYLRASASVFVGNKLIAISPNPPSGARGDRRTKAGKKGEATPNKSYSGKRDRITVGFNTPYATKQHEKKMNPGKFSAQSGNSNPGNQWVTQHLKLDGQDLMKVASRIYKGKF